MSEAAAGSWAVERHSGSAAELHGLSEPAARRRTVRILDVTHPALVLGSTQHEDVLLPDVVGEQQHDVVRRRSGGGVVRLAPGHQVWIDFFVPRVDPLWNDDVVVGAWWAGEVWAAAVDRLGAGPATVHRAGLVANEWSKLICFAGAGPGEVFVGPLKIVGVSQRRSREWAKIQTTAYTVWEPERLLDHLDLSEAERVSAAACLAGRVGFLDSATEVVAEQVMAALPG